MPQAVQSLPYVAWVLLISFAYGSFAFVVVTKERTDATVGYLRFTAAVSGTFALLALALGWSLPAPTDLVINAPFATTTSTGQVFLALFATGTFVYMIGVRLSRSRSRVPGLMTVLLGSTPLMAAAYGWAPTAVDAVPLFVQLVVLSLATGGSLAAVILGHWYLVTPKISDKPLVLQAKLLIGVIGLQVLLFIVWTTLGGGPGHGPFDAFTSGNLLLVVLRLLVTLLFPLVLCWMAWRTALTRSMESATGLLYINLAAVMAGTIGAAALYVSSGLLL
jgi:hypothetical protein